MTRKKTAAVLFTGGKDSTYTIELLRTQGYEVACLVTMISENQESYMLHTSSIQIASLSSRALQIPIMFGKTKGRKEEELSDIAETISQARQEFDFGTIASGGIVSAYQRDRIDGIARKLGVLSASPLWGIDQISYLRRLVSQGYEFILTSVSAEGLDSSWLGKEMTSERVEQVVKLSNKCGFNAAFEGGEAETLVLDSPLFTKEKLEIIDAEVEWHGSYGKLVIKQVELASK